MDADAESRASPNLALQAAIDEAGLAYLPSWPIKEANSVNLSSTPQGMAATSGKKFTTVL